MSSKTMKRALTSARTVTGWSSVTLATAMLAACGGGGGGDSAPPAANNPPTPTNVAPVANAGAAPSVAMPTDTASFTGSATDDSLPAGSSLSYTWEFVSGPAGPNNSPGATLTSTNTAATSARFAGGPGSYVFNFKASDGALTGTSTLNVTVQPNPNTYPVAISSGVSGWVKVTPAEENMDAAKLDVARDYSLLKGVTNNEAGFIVRHGRLVYEWGDITKRYEMKSTTKSVGGLALLLALDEGKLALSDKIALKLSSFGTAPPVDTTAVPTGLADTTVLQLATHTAGLSKPDDPNISPLSLLFAPGTTWSYSDQGLNWLADVLTQTYGQDLSTLMFARIYTNLGIRATDLTWRDNEFRDDTLSVNGAPVFRRELASGINANVNAMARIGLLMLRKGAWGNQPLLTNAIVAKAYTPPPEVATATIAEPARFPLATTNYGILWWTNATGQMADVPKDAYWAWGLHETLIIVVPSLDLVIARAGDRSWRTLPEDWNANYSVLEPFLTPIVQSVTP